MISKIIYKELPIEDIAYLNREEFTENGSEKAFYQNLKQSIAKTRYKRSCVYCIWRQSLW
jgi:hypothetical protein